jgi:putative transcriptional regulator
MNMSSLAPALLVSMPQLVDRNFNRTVVLLCKHSEEGAFGLVVNRPLITTGRIIVDLDPPVTPDHDLQVWIGGPVEPQRSWILFGEERDSRPLERVEGDAVEDPPGETTTKGVRIADGLYLSTSPELLRRLLGPEPPARARLMVGYSGWGPGQLDCELHASAWLISDIDPDLIFETPPDRMWEAAIRRLGADPAALQISKGVH